MTALIATADITELDDVIASAAALFAEDGGVRDPHMDTSWPQRAGEPYYRALIEGDDSIVLLAFRDATRSTVIGHLTGKVAAPSEVRSGVRVATLQSLRVDAGHRRAGVAAELVDAFFEWAREHDADEAAVSAYASNDGALTFYRRAGFADYDIKLTRAIPR